MLVWWYLRSVTIHRDRVRSPDRSLKILLTLTLTLTLTPNPDPNPNSLASQALSQNPMLPGSTPRDLRSQKSIVVNSNPNPSPSSNPNPNECDTPGFDFQRPPFSEIVQILAHKERSNLIPWALPLHGFHTNAVMKMRFVIICSEAFRNADGRKHQIRV